MLYVTDIIERKIWKNEKTGAEASIYGAVPWYSADEAADWAVDKKGWVPAMSNGTYGAGRAPFPNRESAELWAAAVNRAAKEALAFHAKTWADTADHCRKMIDEIPEF